MYGKKGASLFLGPVNLGIVWIRERRKRTYLSSAGHCGSSSGGNLFASMMEVK
jgi:hypothetical protein